MNKAKLKPAYAKRLKAWIDALRSGEYEQTDAQLRHNGKYCCLGVACDLLDASGWRGIDPTQDAEDDVIDGSDYKADDDGYVYAYGTSFIVLNNDVRRKYGLKAVSGKFRFGDLPLKLQAKLEAKRKLLKNMPYAGFDPSYRITLDMLNDRLKFSFEEIADVLAAKPKSMFTKAALEKEK